MENQSSNFSKGALRLPAFLRRKSWELHGKHVMITGGSSGIGKQLAIASVKMGGSVSILARNDERLLSAKAEIEQCISHPSSASVLCVTIDVAAPFEDVNNAVTYAEKLLGPVYLLANSAGYCRAGAFEDLTMDDFHDMMRINYLGSVQVSRCVVDGMKSRRDGRILFISSDAGLGGVFGYTAYSATKFALRGLAEALSMELKPYRVTVTVSFPPDTDTPGFAIENEDRPDETRLISEAAGVCSAETVARACLSDTMNGRFMSTVGREGYFQALLCAGTTPVKSAFELVFQVCIMGLLRLMAIFQLNKFDRIVLGCAENRRKRTE